MLSERTSESRDRESSRLRRKRDEIESGKGKKETERKNRKWMDVITINNDLGERESMTKWPEGRKNEGGDKRETEQIRHKGGKETARQKGKRNGNGKREKCETVGTGNKRLDWGRRDRETRDDEGGKRGNGQISCNWWWEEKKKISNSNKSNQNQNLWSRIVNSRFQTETDQYTNILSPSLSLSPLYEMHVTRKSGRQRPETVIHVTNRK